jgi:hypothetical protein
MPAGNPKWVKGCASPNPGGLSKKVSALRKALEGDGAKAHKVLSRALNSADEQIAMEAVKLVLTYILPKPVVSIATTSASVMTTAELYAAWRAEHPKAEAK